MTTNKHTMALAELAEKGADVDLLREMIQFVAQRLMELDVETLCGAGYGERTAERINHRNGYRPRLWDTRAGSVDLDIPKLRKGSYFPEFLQPRRTAEKALVAVIQEAYIQGVSTRSVDELVKSFGMTGISKSQVSRLCEQIDERVQAFLNRPIEGEWPYLWLDATYIKTRQAGRIVSVAATLAVAVNTDGVREILGLRTGPSEAEPFWTDFLRSLSARGLGGVKLAFEFLVLTATRSGEVRLAVRKEMDLDEGVWTIPGERMKSNREHRVPLSSRAVEVLQEAREYFSGGELVFPSPT